MHIEHSGKNDATKIWNIFFPNQMFAMPMNYQINEIQLKPRIRVPPKSDRTTTIGKKVNASMWWSLVLLPYHSTEIRAHAHTV